MKPFTNDVFLVNEQFADLLALNHIHGLSQLLSVRDLKILKRKKDGSVQELSLRDGRGRKKFYLKRHDMSCLSLLKKDETCFNEWKKLSLLKKRGFSVPSPVLFARRIRGFFGASTFILTESVEGAEKLETFIPAHFKEHSSRRTVLQKRELFRKIAALTRRFHGSGFYHQDYYLGHLYIDHNDQSITIIDLQRAGHREIVTQKQKVKDVAQLFFSSCLTGVFTKTDFMRFLHVYFGVSSLDDSQKRVCRRVFKKTEKIARHHSNVLRRRKNQ